MTEEEIRETIFAMNGNKVPGPDGFSACFFERAWPVIGKDFVLWLLFRLFFSFDKLLKAINATLIALVPKKKNPSSIGDLDQSPIAMLSISALLRK